MKTRSVLQYKAENNIFIFLVNHSELLVCVLPKVLYGSSAPPELSGRCPPLQTHQVVCPILALHLGLVYPQGPFWVPVLGRTHPQALFTV